MPIGEGRGDGDQGSAPNLHIGYFEMLDSESKGTGNFKPYLRTGRKGKKVRQGKRFDYEIRRFYLKPVSDEMNCILEHIENHLAKNYKAAHKLTDQMQPYIKVGIVTTKAIPNGDIQDNSDLQPI